MKLKYEFVISEVCDTWCAVAVGDSARKYSGIISLNETAADMMRLLTENITEEQMVQKMLQMYDVPEEDLRRDVKDFIVRLEAAKVLE